MRPRKSALLTLTIVIVMTAAGQFAGAASPAKPHYVAPGSNVDLLDGLDSTAFALAGHDHDGLYLEVPADGDTISFPFKSADSDALDGLDSAAFSLASHDHGDLYLARSGKAADSDALDGLDSSQLLRNDVDGTMNGRLSIGAPPIPFNGVEGYDLRVRGHSMFRGEAWVMEPAEVSDAQGVRILHDGTKGMVFTSNVDSVYNPSPLFLGTQTSPTVSGMQIETDGRVVMGTGTTAGMPNPLAGLHVSHIGSSDSFRIDDQLADPTPFIIDAAGNVGVGTQPVAGYQLHLKSEQTGGSQIALDTTSSHPSALNFWEDGSQRAFIQKNPSSAGANPNVLEIVSDGRAVPGNPAGISFRIYKAWNDLREAMHIDNDGKVGIGTSSPESSLHVRNGSPGTAGRAEVKIQATSENAYLLLQADGAGASPHSTLVKLGPNQGAGPAGTLKLNNAPSSFENHIVIAPNGNVGVGTGTPKSALEIGGYLQVARVSGAPPSADCDASDETGRMKVDSAAGLLYVCMDGGWLAK